MKKFLVFILVVNIFSCASNQDSQAKKTARTTAAQERINASKAGADVITKDLD